MANISESLNTRCNENSVLQMAKAKSTGTVRKAALGDIKNHIATPSSVARLAKKQQILQPSIKKNLQKPHEDALKPVAASAAQMPINADVFNCFVDTLKPVYGPLDEHSPPEINEERFMTPLHRGENSDRSKANLLGTVRKLAMDHTLNHIATPPCDIPLVQETVQQQVFKENEQIQIDPEMVDVGFEEALKPVAASVGQMRMNINVYEQFFDLMKPGQRIEEYLPPKIVEDPIDDIIEYPDCETIPEICELPPLPIYDYSNDNSPTNLNNSNLDMSYFSFDASNGGDTVYKPMQF